MQRRLREWHCWREAQISRQDLQTIATPICQAIKTKPWALTVRTRQILKLESALWTVLDHPKVHPTEQLDPRSGSSGSCS